MTSLQIYIYGEKYSGYLDIDPDTTLQLEAVTEAFDEDLTTGEFSLPVSIPWTANNRKLLNFSERVVNNKKPDYFFRCDVYEEGWPHITGGKFTLLEKSGEWSYLRGNFNASISGVKGYFGSLIKNKKLKDLTLGGTITFTAMESREFAEDVMKGVLPAYNYLSFVPVAIEGFFQTDRPDYDNEFLAKDTVNNVIESGGSWVFGRPQSAAPTTATISGTAEHIDYRTIPFFKLKYVVRQLFKQYGFTIKGDFIDEPDFDDLLIFNNYGIEKYTTGNADYNRQITPANHVPDMALDDFIQSILSWLKLKLVFTAPQEVTLRYKYKDLFKQNFADVTAFATNTFKSALPGTEQSKGYKIAYTWDSADQFITDRVKDLKDKVFCATVETRVQLNALNIGRTLTTDDYAYVQAENMYYLVADATNPLDIKWDCYSENLQEYISGDGERVIDLTLSTLCQYAEFNTVTALWERRDYLGCRQPGSYTSNAGNTVLNPFGLRIFYGGMRTVYSLSVPNSWNHNKENNNNRFLPYSFMLSGEEGIPEQLHTEWEDFLQNKEVVETNLIYNKRLDELLKKKTCVAIKGIYFLLQKRERSIPADITMQVELVPL